MGESRIRQQSVPLPEGRSGKYLTGGVTNATLPKGLTVEELALPQALELLAARAALGPSKKAGRKKFAKKATKKAAKSAAAPKKAADRAAKATKAAPRKKPPSERTAL